MLLKCQCLLCEQNIQNKYSQIPLDTQLVKLDTQDNHYSPCLVCGQNVLFTNNKHQKRVKNHLKEIIPIKLSQKDKVVKNIKKKKLRKKLMWPADTTSLVGTFWHGMCPIHTETEMCVNYSDLWECWQCRMQIRFRRTPVIMAERGQGKFKTINQFGNKISAIDELNMSGGKISHDLRVK